MKTVYIDNKHNGIDIAYTDNTLKFGNKIRQKYRLIRKGPAESYYKNTLYIFYFTEEMMGKARENGTIYEKRV